MNASQYEYASYYNYRCHNRPKYLHIAKSYHSRRPAGCIINREEMPNDTLVKNIVAKSLGLLWLLDGLLQLQPAMFGQTFVGNILQPLLPGQPHFMQTVILLGIQAWQVNTVVTNSLAALLQITIGILLLFPLKSSHFKIGAYISIGWGLLVWLCGEGAGSLFTGTASIYAGAPGAVLFYMLLAVLLLMPDRVTAEFYPKAVAWTLFFGAALQLQPVFWSANGAQQVAMASSMEVIPALTTFPTYLLNIISAYPLFSNLILIAIPLCLGIALILRPNRITGSLVLIFLLLIWWIGQDFGQLTAIFTNTPTDPQLSPLLALFLIPLFITTDLTKENEKKFRTAFVVLGMLFGFLVLGAVMYGVVVTTIQNPASTSSPMQMHMSG